MKKFQFVDFLLFIHPSTFDKTHYILCADPKQIPTSNSLVMFIDQKICKSLDKQGGKFLVNT